ncbi:WD40-repeat-containing domain protein [Lentinula edodes]|nr:WD40-repeat-containing domain protein [Lentinula edodes]
MSSFKNSRSGKRLCAMYEESENANSARLKTLEIVDIFVPFQENNIQVSYNLGDETRPCAPSESLGQVKDRANDLYKTVLQSELTLSQNIPRRVFTYHSPEKSMSESPLQPQTRKLIAQAIPRIRKVARTPYKSLDAPDISDDFHTNLNTGVGLGFEIYLRRADTDEPTPLCTIPSEKDEYSSGHLSIKHWDFREPSAKPFKESRGHKSEVCDVKWSMDGGVHASILTSGGNDFKLCIWDLRGSTRDPGLIAASNPVVQQATGIPSLYEFKKNKAAVKGLARNAYYSGILASGRGVRDRCIRIRNTTTGRMLNEVLVCNLIWSVTSHELVSTHGYANVTIPNQICVWKYPSMSKFSCLNGHSARVQHVALNPNGDTIVTGSGDQSLHFWNIFPGKTSGMRGGDGVLNYGKLIR